MPAEVHVDGGRRVPSALGGVTTAKADVLVNWPSLSVGLSVKKPGVTSGQVHLTTVDAFLRWAALECGGIPDDARLVIELFTGEAGVPVGDLVDPSQMKSRWSDRHGSNWEVYQNRLYLTTIEACLPGPYNCFVEWMSSHLKAVTSLCFQSGYARDFSDWATFIHYGQTDGIFDLEVLVAQSDPAEIQPSTGRFAGSTLWLPWGFLQVHRPGKKTGPYQLQFHHDMRLISLIVGGV